MADELRYAIVNPDDLVLYDEARRCLDAGADRAAYIISWIAAAEGLLGKLRAMAELHAALGSFVRDFEAAQRSGIAKDQELVTKAFEIGLIDQAEKIALDAMRDLRKQYGHPTAATPSHASSEHALHTTVMSVLAKPPLIMHGAARQLAERAAADHHLVPHDEAAINTFAQTRAAVMHRDARPLFIKELLAGANQQLQDVNGALLAARCLQMAVVALQEWSEQLMAPRWKIDEIQRTYPAPAAEVFSDPIIWQFLDSENKDRVLSLCLDRAIGEKFTTAPGRLLGHADRLLVEGLLTTSQEARAESVFSVEDPRRILGSGVRFEYVARAIIRLLKNSSFTVAGEGVTVLRACRPEDLQGLDAGLKRQIGSALAHAATQNTYAAINEVEDIAAQSDAWPEELRAGVVVGSLVGTWVPLSHPQTCKAAFRIALADPDGKFAQDALDNLTPDKMQAMISPALIAELRAMLMGADADPVKNGLAVSSLKEFLDRIEAGQQSQVN